MPQGATSLQKPVTQCTEDSSENGYKCVCLKARSIVNKKHELNIMGEDINSHINGISQQIYYIG